MTTAPTPTSRPTAAVIFDGGRSNFRDRAKALLTLVQKHCTVSVVHDDLETPFSPGDAQFAIVMGGDGTILRSARLMGHQQLPVLGVNLGKLGFLAAVAPDQLEAALAEVADNEHRLVDHLMFECRLLGESGEKDRRLGLNEMSVHAGEPFRMLSTQLFVDGDMVATYECDGLIISTPVGSTAHNLAAGGPILRKSLQAFVISPLNPHTLTNRPVVDTADRAYEVVVPEPHSGTTLLVDGQVVAPLAPGDRVHVERSDAVFQLVEVSGQSYYGTLREKLGWQRRPREK